jgi:hypothetical protein
MLRRRLNGLFTGANIGKMLVKVGEPAGSAQTGQPSRR